MTVYHEAETITAESADADRRVMGERGALVN
jgi:hypothetical protein